MRTSTRDYRSSRVLRLIRIRRWSEFAKACRKRASLNTSQWRVTCFLQLRQHESGLAGRGSTGSMPPPWGPRPESVRRLSTPLGRSPIRERFLKPAVRSVPATHIFLVSPSGLHEAVGEPIGLALDRRIEHLDRVLIVLVSENGAFRIQHEAGCLHLLADGRWVDPIRLARLREVGRRRPGRQQARRIRAASRGPVHIARLTHRRSAQRTALRGRICPQAVRPETTYLAHPVSSADAAAT